MATKIQSQLQYTIRRSARQRASKANTDREGSPLRPGLRSARNCKKAVIPRKIQQTDLPFEVSPTRNSPSKRKSAAIATPPTPPKSPCKSVKSAPSRVGPLAHSDQRSRHVMVSDILDTELPGSKTPTKRASNDSPPASMTKSSTCSSPCSYPTESTLLTTPTKAVCRGRSFTSPRPHTTPSKFPYGERLCSPPRPPSTTLLAPCTERMPIPPRQPTTPLKSHHGERLPSSPRQITTPSKPSCAERLSSPVRLPTTPSKSPFREKFCSPRRSSSPTKIPFSVQFSSAKKLQEHSSCKTVLSPHKNLKENGENFVLKSPRKPPSTLQIAKQDGHCYQMTKQSLHTAKPDHMVGRDQEVAEITGFLKTHLDQQTAGSLYISGAPGTGKTAALLHIIDDFKFQYKCQLAYLNCMMVKDVSSVFRRLHSELSGKPPSGRTTVKDMEKLITSSKHCMILVLDEIDQLDSKNQEVLYHIFEWPTLDNSKLILVGVANALDLTDRILPRLQAKPRCRPTLLHFAPYTRDQITAIIKDRLAGAGAAIVEQSAVQFCARKVSAVAGDMRKALDVCRRAVELAESETKQQTVLKISDCNSPSKSQPAMKKIGVAHISKVMSEVYGSSVQSQQSDGVPLQQKLLVCTLLLVVKTGKFKEVMLGKLHETYCKVCKRQQMTPVDQSEFHSLCILLEARGVIGIKKAKETRLMKLMLRQDEKELEQTLQDRILVSSILKEGLPK